MQFLESKKLFVFLAIFTLLAYVGLAKEKERYDEEAECLQLCAEFDLKVHVFKVGTCICGP